MAEFDISGDSATRSETNNLDDSVDSGNNSIIGKVKSRVSSIIPNTFSKWFSPTIKTSSDLPHNGSLNAESATGPRRRRRCIELDDDEDDGEGVGDGEEASLADNIAEHDLDGEEQSRGDLNVMRSAKVPGRNVDLKDNEDDEEVGKKIIRPPTLSDRSTHNPHNENIYKIHSSQISKQPPLKRKRISTEFSIRDSPIMIQRRPLVTSTPGVGTYLRSNVSNPLTTAPRIHSNRYGHMNLYRNQTKREPAYNFNVTTAEPALATSGDLPAVVDANTGLSKVVLSSRRSLNIPALDSHNFLPKLRRQSLSTVKNTGTLALLDTMPLRSSTAIERSEELRDTESFGVKDFENGPPTNINNNNINDKHDVDTNRQLLNGVGGVSSHLASLDTTSEGSNEGTESHILARLNKDNGSRSRTSSVDNMLDFYAHLHGKKSLFSGPQQLNQQQRQVGLASMSALNNSTLSLTSLNRRQFNASIYGSTSALSDSRLLNTFSPFYKGRTTYGGASAYNKYNTTLSASGITGATGAGASFMRMAPTVIRPTSSLSTISSSNNSIGHVGGSNGEGEVSGISDTAQRILALLNDFTSPLIDAKRMATNLREHQQIAKLNRLKDSDLQTSRSTRNYRLTPYSQNTDTSKLGGSIAKFQNGGNKLLQPPTRELIVPKMGLLMELRDFQNTTERLRGIAMEKPILEAEKNSIGKQTNLQINAYDAQQQQQKYVSKMRPKIVSNARITSSKVNALEDETLPQVPLPNLTFPMMHSVPKFDIKLPIHVPTTMSTKGITSASAATPPPIKIFAFNDQLAKTNCCSDPTLEFNSEFHFSAPVKYLTKLKNLPGVESNFKFSSPTSLVVAKLNTVVNSQIPKPAIHLRSGTVLDVIQPMHKFDNIKNDSLLGKTSGSFGTQFKQTANEWECDACMLRNKQSDKCVACETPRVSNNANAKPNLILQSSVNLVNNSKTINFGDKFKKSSAEWECEACMVRNKLEANKCVACETPRKCETISQLTSNVPIIANSFGNTFKPQAGTWECSVCLIVNKNNDLECIACQSTKPGATVSLKAPISSGLIQEPPKFKFGFAANNLACTDVNTNNISVKSETPSSNPDDIFKMIAASQNNSKWSCSACFAQNESGRVKCICCEEPKPDTLSAKKSGPTFSFGQAVSKTVNNLEFANKDNKLCSTTNASVSSTSTPATFGFEFGSSKTWTTTTSGADSTGTANKKSETTGFKIGISYNSQDTTSNNSQDEKVPKSVTLHLPTNKSTVVTSTVVEVKNNDISKPSYGPSFGMAPPVTPATSKSSTSDISLSQPAVLPTAIMTANSDTPKSQNSTIGEFAFSTSTTSTILSSTSTAPITIIANAISTSTISFDSGTISSPISSFSFGSASKLGATVTSNANSSNITFGSFSKTMTKTTNTSTAPSTITATNLFGTVESSLSNSITTTKVETIKAASTTTTTAQTVTNSFIFGQQATGGVVTTTASSSAQATTNKFIFGPPPIASTSMATSIFSGNSATSSVTVPSNHIVFGSYNVGASSSGSDATASTASDSIVDAAKSTEKVKSLTFGAKLESNSTFSPIGAAAKTAVTSTATSGNVFGSFGGTTSTPTFGSVAPSTTPIFSIGSRAASKVSSSSETAGVFCSFAGKVASAPSNSIFSSNSAVQPSSTFSDFAPGVSHGIGADQSTITVPQATFGHFSTSSANNVATPAPIQTFGGFGTAASATASTAAIKPAFNFGSAATLQNPNSSGGVFSFGSNASSAGNNATTKPAFNFTATSPTVNFNFTNSAAVNSSTSDQPANRPFQFGTTFTPAAAPMSMNVFSFGTGDPYAEATTNTSAPFQFNAGAAAPANIFAINPTTTGGSNAQNSQQARRKIRAPTRRLTPR